MRNSVGSSIASSGAWWARIPIEPTAVRVADCRWVASNEFENYRFPAADQATMDLLLGIKRA